MPGCRLFPPSACALRRGNGRRDPGGSGPGRSDGVGSAAATVGVSGSGCSDGSGSSTVPALVAPAASPGRPAVSVWVSPALAGRAARGAWACPPARTRLGRAAGRSSGAAHREAALTSSDATKRLAEAPVVLAAARPGHELYATWHRADIPFDDPFELAALLLFPDLVEVLAEDLEVFLFTADLVENRRRRSSSSPSCAWKALTRLRTPRSCSATRSAARSPRPRKARRHRARRASRGSRRPGPAAHDAFAAGPGSRPRHRRRADRRPDPAVSREPARPGRVVPVLPETSCRAPGHTCLRSIARISGPRPATLAYSPAPCRWP